MIITILAVLAILAGIGWLAFGEPRATGLIPIVLAFAALFLASITSVQAKQVGVVTTFGKPSEQTLSSGLHFKAPWQKVTEIDATIQTDEYHGKSGIDVRLSDGNAATISATIRWSVSAENASKVFADFRSDDPTQSLRDAVVSTQFKAAMNSVFAGFDPLTLAGTTGQKPDYIALSAEVEAAMLKQTNALVEIDSITISLVKLDKDSQKKIDDYIGEVSKTRIAEQAQKTAEAQAKANKILSESISNDPNVLVSKCLDLLAEGYNAPAGFTCWPGASGGVVIPGTR
jgi:regulator of protease activity HflC (stomatin/prohibitin superfamily)